MGDLSNPFRPLGGAEEAVEILAGGDGRSGRHADLEEGALIAFRLAGGGGRDPGGDEPMEPGRGLFGQAPELGVERHVETMPGLAIEESAGRYVGAQHFFEAEGLSTELDLVGPVAFRPAAFVFNRKRPPRTLIDPVKLDDVGFSGEPEPEAAQGKRPGDPEIAPGFLDSAVRLLVEVTALDGQRIFHPDLLQMDQSALPLAEQQVLQGGKREEVVFAEHRSHPPDHRISRRLTPAGRRSRAMLTS